MIGLNMVLASITTISIAAAMILLKNKALVFDWERGLKIYIEQREEDNDELQ